MTDEDRHNTQQIDRVARMMAGRAIALRSKARAAATLTAPKATTQARRIVDKIMPGVVATVESRLSHDLASDTPLVITEITFPVHHPRAHELGQALGTLTGVQNVAPGVGRRTVVRKR